jgi:hypothetical protein
MQQQQETNEINYFNSNPNPSSNQSQSNLNPIQFDNLDYHYNQNNNDNNNYPLLNQRGTSFFTPKENIYTIILSLTSYILIESAPSQRKDSISNDNNSRSHSGPYARPSISNPGTNSSNSNSSAIPPTNTTNSEFTKRKNWSQHIIDEIQVNSSSSSYSHSNLTPRIHSILGLHARLSTQRQSHVLYPFYS